jgi:hypothetical protein
MPTLLNASPASITPTTREHANVDVGFFTHNGSNYPHKTTLCVHLNISHTSTQNLDIYEVQLKYRNVYSSNSKTSKPTTSAYPLGNCP